MRVCDLARLCGRLAEGLRKAHSNFVHFAWLRKECGRAAEGNPGRGNIVLLSGVIERCYSVANSTKAE